MSAGVPSVRQFRGLMERARVPAGVMLSVVAEGVNEALFPRFADTVILFEGDAPLLIEDYIEELKGMIAP